VALDAIYGFTLDQDRYRARGASDLAPIKRRAAVGGGLGLAFCAVGRMPVDLEVSVSYAIDPAPSQDRWTSYVGF
jgi:hypothetical protein